MNIKNIFLNGIKVFLPVAVTFATVYWVFNTIEKFFGHLIKLWLPEAYYFVGMGSLLGILFVCAVGILVNAWIIKQLYQLLNWVLQQIPFIKTVYSAMLDLMKFFDTKNTDNQQAVIISTSFGKMIGFVTRDNLSGLPENLGNKNSLLVYVPCSYQIGGLTLAVDRKDIEFLDMPANEAMSFVLTAGMTGGNRTRSYLKTPSRQVY